MRPPVLDDESTLNDESTKEKKSFWSEPQSIRGLSRNPRGADEYP